MTWDQQNAFLLHFKCYWSHHVICLNFYTEGESRYASLVNYWHVPEHMIAVGHEIDLWYQRRNQVLALAVILLLQLKK